MASLNEKDYIMLWLMVDYPVYYILEIILNIVKRVIVTYSLCKSPTLTDGSQQTITRSVSCSSASVSSEARMELPNNWGAQSQYNEQPGFLASLVRWHCILNILITLIFIVTAADHNRDMIWKRPPSVQNKPLIREQPTQAQANWLFITDVVLI